jgi:hypothetical protein
VTSTDTRHPDIEKLLELRDGYKDRGGWVPPADQRLVTELPTWAQALDNSTREQIWQAISRWNRHLATHLITVPGRPQTGTVSNCFFCLEMTRHPS